MSEKLNKLLIEHVEKHSLRYKAKIESLIARDWVIEHIKNDDNNEKSIEPFGPWLVVTKDGRMWVVDLERSEDGETILDLTLSRLKDPKRTEPCDG